MNDTNKMPESLLPYGMGTNHFENLISSKNYLWLKELGYDSIANTLKGYQNSLEQAMREMTRDNRESRLGKTQILAKMSDTMQKSMMSLTNGQLNLAGKKINTLSEIGERKTTDTPQNQEIRELLRAKNISNNQLMLMAEEDITITRAMLTSPHVGLAYGFSDKQMDKLNAMNFKHNLGDDHKLLKNAIKLHDVITDTQATMNRKFDSCITASKDNSYGSSAAIVAAS